MYRRILFNNDEYTENKIRHFHYLPFLSISFIHSFIHSFIRSFQYLDSFSDSPGLRQLWYNSFKIKHITLEQLEPIKRRATRQIPGPGWKTSHVQWEIEGTQVTNPLIYTRIRGDMIEAFKIINGIYVTGMVPGSLNYGRIWRKGGDRGTIHIKFPLKNLPTASGSTHLYHE